MKPLITFLFGLFLSLGLKAQEYKLSLAEAVDLGLKNKIALKNQQLTVSISENEEAKTRTKNLPQISASFDARVNTELQTQVISPQATGGSAASDPIRAKFGTKYYNVLAVNLNQNLFSPAIRYDKMINRERSELERLNLEKNEIDAVLSISEAYLDAMYKKVRWEASRFNHQVARDKFLRAQTQFRSGTELKIDFDKDRLDERNARQSSRNDSSQYRLALEFLANELTLPPGATLQLTELTETAESLNAAVGEPNPANRVEIRTEMRQLSIYELSRTKQKASYFPVVSFFANYTVQQFNKAFNPTDGRYWSPYNYVGFRMEIPVFDGFMKEKTRKEFTYRIEQSKNNVIQLNQQIRYEIQVAQWGFEDAQTNYKLSIENYDAAKEILKTDLVRLQAGAILPVEAKNSEYAMMIAQNNYLNSFYQYLLSRLRLQKAMGAVH